MTMGAKYPKIQGGNGCGAPPEVLYRWSTSGGMRVSGQRVAQEIALESEQAFGHGLVVGHMGDARQR